MYLPIRVRIYRIAFGLLAFYALYDKRQDRLWDTHFYQFFTNQSGIIAGLILLTGGTILAHRGPPLWWDYVRGAGVMIALLTALVFAFVLDGLYNPFTDTSQHWADTVFHQLLPLVMLVDLLITPLDRRVSWWGLVMFPIYPLAYLGYCLWIGETTGWYAYAFMDPYRIGRYGPWEGWAGVAFANAVLLAGFVVLSAIVLVLSRTLAARRAHPPPLQP